MHDSPLALQMLRIASMGLKPPPQGQDAFTLARFGRPPAARGAAPVAAGASGGGDGELAKAPRKEGASSPRASAAAAQRGPGGGVGVLRAVALQQVQQAAQQQDPAKRLRAVQKKLRQIKALAEKQATGAPLTVSC